HDGYGCVAVARAEPGLNAPGLVVVLGRQVGSQAAVSHRVITASGAGADLQPLLEGAGGEGFHLCGVVLDEGATMPTIVAIMSHGADASSAIWHYGVEVLTNYKRSIATLN